MWGAYDDIGSKADRDALSDEVIFGGKQVNIDEFTPNRAIFGTPDQCAEELQRIKEKVNPEYVTMISTGVPDIEQHRHELRLFANEVMPAFKD